MCSPETAACEDFKAAVILASKVRVNSLLSVHRRSALADDQMWFILVRFRPFIIWHMATVSDVFFLFFFYILNSNHRFPHTHTQKNNNTQMQRPRIVEHVLSVCVSYNVSVWAFFFKNSGWWRRGCCVFRRVKFPKNSEKHKVVCGLWKTTAEMLLHDSQASMQAGAVRSAKATVAFYTVSFKSSISTRVRKIFHLACGGGKLSACRYYFVYATCSNRSSTTCLVDSLQRRDLLSKNGEGEPTGTGGKEHVNYFRCSGVENYPCEFWPALLLFCMMLCFEKNAS